eukprot:9481851-Pyramimonas_sp.AAC.1
MAAKIAAQITKLEGGMRATKASCISAYGPEGGSAASALGELQGLANAAILYVSQTVNSKMQDVMGRMEEGLTT